MSATKSSINNNPETHSGDEFHSADETDSTVQSTIVEDSIPTRYRQASSNSSGSDSKPESDRVVKVSNLGIFVTIPTDSSIIAEEFTESQPEAIQAEAVVVAPSELYEPEIDPEMKTRIEFEPEEKLLRHEKRLFPAVDYIADSESVEENSAICTEIDNVTTTIRPLTIGADLAIFPKKEKCMKEKNPQEMEVEKSQKKEADEHLEVDISSTALIVHDEDDPRVSPRVDLDQNEEHVVEVETGWEDEPNEDDEEDEEDEDEDEDEIEDEDEDERGSGDGEQSPDDDEDRRNPAYIPKSGQFYMHDQRSVYDDDGISKVEYRPGRADVGRWEHDRFDDRERMNRNHGGKGRMDPQYPGRGLGQRARRASRRPTGGFRGGRSLAIRDIDRGRGRGRGRGGRLVGSGPRHQSPDCSDFQPLERVSTATTTRQRGSGGRIGNITMNRRDTDDKWDRDWIQGDVQSMNYHRREFRSSRGKSSSHDSSFADDDDCENNPNLRQEYLHYSSRSNRSGQKKSEDDDVRISATKMTTYEDQTGGIRGGKRYSTQRQHQQAQDDATISQPMRQNDGYPHPHQQRQYIGPQPFLDGSTCCSAPPFVPAPPPFVPAPIPTPTAYYREMYPMLSSAPPPPLPTTPQHFIVSTPPPPRPRQPTNAVYFDPVHQQRSQTSDNRLHKPLSIVAPTDTDR